jgi:hypothetical protein
VANAVADGANQMADMFFRQGAQAAEKTGLEQGASIAQEKVLAIDPKTGEPVAYDAPQGFGTIAQEAYQRVVLSRFQTGIEQEIKLKAQELAVKHDGSVGRYTAAMSDYIGAMTENADGQFKTYINDVGTSYLNVTRSAMAMDQIRRERASAASSLGDSIGEGTNFLEWQYSQNGPEAAAAGPTMSNATELGVQKAIQDGVTSGLIPSDKAKAAQGEITMAKIRGLVRFAGKSGATPDELTLLNSAIGTANPALVPEQFSYIRDAMIGLGGNFSALAELEKFSSGIFDDAITAANVVQRQEVEAAKNKEAVNTFNINESAADRASVATDIGMKYSASSVAELASSKFGESTATITEYLNQGLTDQAKAATDARDLEFDAYAKGVGLKALNGLTPPQTEQVEAAIMANNPNLAPPTARSGVAAILSMERVKAGTVDSFITLTGSYRDGSGRYVLEQQQAQAFDKTNAFVPEAVNLIQTSTAANVEPNLATFNARLNGVVGLKPEDKARFQRQGYQAAGISYLSAFFASNPTSEEISQAESYISTGTSTDALKASSKAMLDMVREYGTKSNNEAELRTQFGILERRAADMALAKQKAQDTQSTLIQINNGSASPSDEKAQTILDEALSQKYGVNLSETLLDPTMPQKSLQIMDEVVTKGVMPISLANILKSAATGGLQSSQTMIAISHWNNLRTKTDANGAEIISPIVNGVLTQDQIATLDMLSAYGSTPENITNLLQAKAQYERDPVFKQNVEQVLGTPDSPKSVEQFVLGLNGIQDAPLSAFNEIKAAALVLFSTQSVTGFDVSTIQSNLERQIARSYPDGGGIVYSQNGKSRTGAALSMTASGFETEFQNYVRERASRIGIVKDRNTGNVQNFPAGSVGFKAAESFYRSYENPIFLMPIGTASGPNTKYRVMMWRSNDEGGPVSILSGSTQTPLILSPNDIAFVRIKDAKNRLTISQETEYQKGLMELGIENLGLMSPF